MAEDSKKTPVTTEDNTPVIATPAAVAEKKTPSKKVAVDPSTLLLTCEQACEQLLIDSFNTKVAVKKFGQEPSRTKDEWQAFLKSQRITV